MSEVNPLGGGWGKEGPNSYDTIYEQALHWYGISLSSQGFIESAVELESICKQKEKTLIIRDWPYVNFVPHEYNDYRPPGKLLTIEALKNEIEILPLIFVRDAIDIWISRGMPPVAEFFDSYHKYIHAILELNASIFKYEAFCLKPRAQFKKICDYAGLAFVDVLNSFQEFTNVSGDSQMAGGSRGMRQGAIKPLPRKIIPYKKIIEVNRCKMMKEVNEIMGYPTSYFNSHRLIDLISRKDYYEGSDK
jgi:hypothetical protein